MELNQAKAQSRSEAEKIRNILHAALGKIGKFDRCALLDYPNHLNIGDHFIWLATVFYIADVVGAKIGYAASVENFSAEKMEKQVGKAPILLQGGGNLGDLWPRYQKFREEIISKYRDRPIFIMPQCIYFADPEKLKQAAAIFNAHPNLTIFTRDDYSYELAQKNFSNCQVVKSPDMAFHLMTMPLSLNVKPKIPVLYLSRKDSELNRKFSPDSIDLPHLVVRDWITYEWAYRENFQDSAAWYWRLPGIVRLVREGWQRRLGHPIEWISRNKWEKLQPYSDRLNFFDNPELHRHSWNFMHGGLYQLQQAEFIITNRLHVHVFCIFLGIPHIFLPNAYHKNKSFYETWTGQMPLGRFVEEASQIKPAVLEMMEISQF